MGFFAASSAFCHETETVKSDGLTWLEQYNVVWTSQSSNSGEVSVLFYFLCLITISPIFLVILDMS